MGRGKPATSGQLSLFDAPARPAVSPPHTPVPGTSTIPGTPAPPPDTSTDTAGSAGALDKAPGRQPLATPAARDTAGKVADSAMDDEVPAWLSAPDWATPPEEYPAPATSAWEEAGWEEPPLAGNPAAHAACAAAHTPTDATHGPDPCPPAWRAFVPELAAGAHLPLLQRVAALRARQTIYPAQANIFAALQAAAPENVRVIILGQDPYHGPGQAHGLCFSVQPPCPAPPSLVNIFKEIQADVYGGAPLPDPSACLTRWARQGVLLLNTILSVQAGRALSHANLGWQAITRGILTALAAHHPLAVLLWGRPAQDAAAGLFRTPPHLVLRAPHPSPLSAHRGFFGCRHFSRANRWLEGQGLPPIRW